jgi:phosphoribosylaminoimidazolecarboxamide formyltransferase/IMP cyclohydrolase
MAAKFKALISVSDKTGVAAFARALQSLGAEILSTGGTALMLAGSGVAVKNISELTGFPECLDGRVKTLHPAVHGGILAVRGKEEHMRRLAELGIETIDLVAINLYPFKETIAKPGVTREEAIENIDIGGPAMLRSAAKNSGDVTVLCDPADYEAVLSALSAGGVPDDMRRRLALKAFEHTAAYDAMIAAHLRAELGAAWPDKLTLTFEKAMTLRYGENPHQQAVYYKEPLAAPGALASAEQLHGKELSFNNLNDANGALAALLEFDEAAVVAVKHANPCGVAVGKDIREAYLKAYAADPVSIFGGIVAANRPIDAGTAEEIDKIFVEIVLAPGFTDAALRILTRKKNIRLLRLAGLTEASPRGALDIKRVSGGILVQDADADLYGAEDWKVVTERAPTEAERADMDFAMKVVKHVKSNAVVIAKGGKTLGIGPGQVNRIWAVQNAIRQASDDLTGAVLASDAFFPFDDCVSAAAAAGIAAVIQPGGSVNDADSIKKANEAGMSMVFTGMRHFKH